MPDTSQNLSFAITAVDKVESQVAKINKAIFSIGATAKQVSTGSGGLSSISVNARAAGIVARELGERGARAMERFGKATEGVGNKLGAFSPALAGLTSLTTLAGLGEMSRRSAEFGASITRTSAQVGVAPAVLQRWSGAMYRAGFAAENTASMLAGVNKASLEARAGFNPQAWGIAQLEKINLTGDTTKTILSIADAIKRMHAAGENAETEGQVLDAFGISRDHLALFEQGSAGIKRLLDLRGDASALSDKEIGQLTALDQSFRGLTQSASDFGSAVAASVSEPMARAADNTAKWLDHLRQAPEVMKAVGAGAGLLSTALSAGALGKLLFGAGAASGGIAGLTALWAGGGAAAHSLGKEATGQILSGAGDATGTLPGMPNVADTKRALDREAPAAQGPGLWDRIIDGLGIRAHDASPVSPGAYRHGGIVPSARGGWVVPGSAFAGGGSPAILHPREMVLPAPISQGMQQLIGQMRPAPGLGATDWARGNNLSSAIDRISTDIHEWIYGSQVPNVRLAELGPGVDTAFGDVGIAATGASGSAGYRPAGRFGGMAPGVGGGTGSSSRATGPLPQAGAPSVGDPRGMIPVIRAAAQKYGIDPDVAVRVARAEGLGTFLGDHGKSGGAFQLYTGGGVGNQFQRDTGLDPLNPINERATIDYAMRRASKEGWGAWHGAARAGIGRWQGIGVTPASIAPAAGIERLSAGSVDLSRVNPALVESMRAATMHLPPGIRAVVTSGERVGGLANSAHHGGNAMDVQLYGADGRPIPNRGVDTTGDYGLLARAYYGEMLRLHPEMTGKAAWGGNFETEPGSGVADLMHYDVAGDRGRYGRLADEYKLLGVPPTAEDEASRDTSHEITIHHVNAPPGTRMTVDRADGPSKLNLRTSYSMSDVW